MSRKILVALILALLVPVGAMASQIGLYGALSGQGSSIQGVSQTSLGMFTFGGMMYSENWLIDFAGSFVLNANDPGVAAPAYGGASLGYMIGKDATRTRPCFLLGINTEVDGEHYYSGPKATFGLSFVAEDATLIVVGPEIFYTVATKEFGYRVIAKFVWKLGASQALPPGAGAGGETPRGLFPAQ